MRCSRIVSVAILVVGSSSLAVAQVPLSGAVFDGSGGPLTTGTVYHVSGSMNVPVGKTLTIQPGAIVKFNAGGLSVQGTLSAIGTLAPPIVFTSLQDDSAGGDTNGNGPSVGQPDQWGGLGFGPTSDASVLDRIDVRYSGIGFSPAIDIDQSNLTLTRSALHDGQHGLLRLNNGALPTVTACTFTNSGSQPSITGVTLDALPQFSGNTATGTGAGNYVRVGASTMTGAIELTTDNLVNDALVFPTTFSVPSGATLTLQEGIVVKVMHSVQFAISGTLITDGEQNDPVVFTYLPDDEYGGDTNNDGPSVGATDTWAGLAFQSTASASTLRNTVVRYTGVGFTAALELFGADITATDCLLRDGRHSAIDFNGQPASPSFVRCAFQDNFNTAVNNLPITAVPAFVDCVALGAQPGQYLRVTNGVVTQPTTISKRNVLNGGIVMATSLTVPVGQTLTLERGAIFKWEGHGSTAVSGTMHVVADGSEPVVLTMLKDDEFGGDTNGDGPSVGLSDTWSGVSYAAGSSGSIAGLRVRYAGVGFTPCVNLDSSAVSARGVRADLGAHDGIRVSALSGDARDFVADRCNDAGLRLSGGSFALRNATVYGGNSAGIVATGWTGDVVDSIVFGTAGAETVGLTAARVKSSRSAQFQGSNGNIGADPQFVAATTGDLRLLASSPCVETATPTASATGADAGGAPRFTDGNLDGVRRLDMGAYEFTNVGLQISGFAGSGGTLTFDVTGTPGLATLLVVGFDGQAELGDYGTLFIQTGLPILVLPWASAPSSLALPLPPNLPAPFDVAFQMIASSGSKANLSNVEHVRITY
ncbi:MAG: hypothetical protein JNL94_09615 [Planctomycetes bacterium]|nr:hypothetical protein [Planctomycetota bacterium]